MDIQQPSQPNLLINGMMELWQRAVTLVAVANGTYVADRWRAGQVITGTGPTLDQSLDVPTKAVDGFNGISPFSFRYIAPGADVFTATEFADMTQAVEGYNFAPHRFGTFALQFKVKSTLAGIYSIAFRNQNSDASYVTEYTINNANTWEEKIVFMKEPPPLTLGTWNFNDSIGLLVAFNLDGGSNFRTSQIDQWVSGAFTSSANSVNFFANGAEEFKFCDAMFTPGPYAIPVARAGRDFGDELSKAQRYFGKSYNLANILGSLTNSGMIVARHDAVSTYTNTAPMLQFPVRMRAIPTMTLYDSLGVANRMAFSTGSTTTPDGNGDTISSLQASETGVRSVNNTASRTVHFFHYGADAEL